jgi:hypothetical protein
MNQGTLLGIEKKNMNDVVATVTHDFSEKMLRWKRILQAYVSGVSDVSFECCMCFI